MLTLFSIILAILFTSELTFVIYCNPPTVKYIQEIAKFDLYLKTNWLHLLIYSIFHPSFSPSDPAWFLPNSIPTLLSILLGCKTVKLMDNCQNS